MATESLPNTWDTAERLICGVSPAYVGHRDELVSGLPVMDLQSGGRGGPQIPGEKSHRRESLAGVEEICLEEVDLFSDEGSTHLPTPSPTP